MEGGRGTTWANFEESAQKSDSAIGWPSTRNPLSPTAGRLCREDMAIYGEEPASDGLSLVVCVECGRVVKSQALVNHKEQYHSENFKVPVPHPLMPPLAPPTRPSHTVGVPSSAMSTNNPSSLTHHGSNQGELRGGENISEPGLGGVGMVMGFTASDLPSAGTSNMPVVGKGIKEYNANRHCGVWIEEDNRHCTHSLTCKFHSIQERRNVRGRRKLFDVLLEERKHKKKKNELKSKSDSSHQLPLQSPSHSSSRFELVSPPSATSFGQSGFIEGTGASWITSPVEARQLPSLSTEELIDIDSFPKPLAVCSFGSHSTVKGGGLLLGRRSDNLRSALATLSGRSRDYTHTTLHRKHSYNSLLKRRTARKYYNRRHQHQEIPVSQQSIKLPVPLHANPPPPTLSQPLTSPLTASAVLTNINSLSMIPATRSDVSSPSITSLSSPPHTYGEEEARLQRQVTFPPSNVYTSRAQDYTISNPLNVLTSEAGPVGNHFDYLNEVSSVEVVPVQQETTTPVQSMETDSVDTSQTSKTSGKKSKSRRSKKRKHKQSKSSVGISEDPLPVGNLTSNALAAINQGGSSSEDIVRTRHDHSTERWNDQGEHAATRVPMNGTVIGPHFSEHEYEGRGAEASQGRVTEPSLAPSYAHTNEIVQKSVGTVRVKQEPVTDHEDLHDQQQMNNPISKSPSLPLNGLVTPTASPPIRHTFNSVNSPQSFVINPSRQLSGALPLMTTLSPHVPVRGMLPLPGMSHNPNLFANQQHQRFQLAPPPVTSSQVGGTAQLHLPGSSLMSPEQLQRHVMQQNPAFLFANHALLQQRQEFAHQLLQQQSMQNSPVNSLSPGGFFNIAANVNRSVSTGSQKSPSMGGLSRLPQVSGSGGTGLGKTGHLTNPILSSFQIPGTNLTSSRTSQASSKVRAPISHIPSNSQSMQRVMPNLTSLGQAQNIPALNQSQYHHHSKQSTTPSSAAAAQRFSSQQVT